MLIALPLNDPRSVVRPYPLSDRPLLIGRHADCEVRLDHISISRHHAKVHFHNTLWQVSDLNSRNGTFRNGQRIESGQLQEGDILHIGDWAMAFSGRSAESLETMTSWLERIKQKASDYSIHIYLANNIKSVGTPISSLAPPAVKSTPQGKIVRTKPTDILKSAVSPPRTSLAQRRK
jgi:pSer/pThr/pTyr-binding forkhead associated (FHA) protein